MQMCLCQNVPFPRLLPLKAQRTDSLALDTPETEAWICDPTHPHELAIFITARTITLLPEPPFQLLLRPITARHQE